MDKKSSSLNITNAYQGFLDEPVPSALFDVIVSDKVTRLVKAVKIGLLLLAGFLIAIAIGHVSEEHLNENIETVNLQQLAVSSHATFATDAIYPVHVTGDDIYHLMRWISYRLGKHVKIKQLDSIGYTLLGGNLIPDGNTASASIVYENQHKKRTTLFVRKSHHIEKSQAPQQGQQGEFNWLSWESGQGQQVIVSELDHEELLKMFKALQD